MERYNFHAIEKKWRAKLNNKKLENKNGNKFYCQKCFLIHQAKYIWVTLEIIQLECNSSF